MRKSARLAEKQVKPANEAQMEPRAKKKRSDGGISNIPKLDNGTMVAVSTSMMPSGNEVTSAEMKREHMAKPLPSFIFDVICYLNRDQLERFSIVGRPLKNFIDRYFNVKPYRIFVHLHIRGESYALVHNDVQWHPNRNNYTVQQFLAGHKCPKSKHPRHGYKFYSLAELRLYLGPTVRIKVTNIQVAGGFFYTHEQIAKMESISHLWRDGNIDIGNYVDAVPIVAKDLQPILNSPTILKCQELCWANAHFSFKDYKILYSVKVLIIAYGNEDEIDPSHWSEFLQEPIVKPVVVLHTFGRKNIDILIDGLSKNFSSAVVPNAFKVVFVEEDLPMTEFQKKNKTSAEALALKKGFPLEFRKEYWQQYDSYTLERSIV